MISFKQKGDYSKTTKYLQRAKKCVTVSDLQKYGEAGVNALASNTPVETGLTANSWYYEIENKNGVAKITF